MAEKAAADTAAYARTLAEARRRNVALAAEAVTESRAFTDHEALNASRRSSTSSRPTSTTCCGSWMGAPCAASTAATVDARHARSADRARRMTLAPVGARRHRSSADRLPAADPRHARASSSSSGIRASVLPGVAGGLCLLLAFFAFQVLPVNVTGLLLIVFGMALLGARAHGPELRRARHRRRRRAPRGLADDHARGPRGPRRLRA